MKLDAFLTTLDIGEAGRVAHGLEEAGYHGAWLAETQMDPLLPLAAAAPATARLRLGTGIAVAFPRSPMVMAMDAWAIQKASAGRFDLGLGAQVRGHIERRFSSEHERPMARIREYIAALRHIWGAFQGEHRLSFRGDFYQHTLLTPFFDPGPIEHPRIPIYLAAVNARMFRLAGEIADGVVAHPFHTAAYLREVALPALGRGLERAGRARSDVQIACPVFVVVGEDPEAERYVRQQLAFYASTPAYRAVLAHHGWDALGEELSALARQGRFDELAGVLPDEVVDAFVTRGATHAEAGARLRERYAGLLERIGLYGPAALGIGREDLGAMSAALA